MSTNDIDTTIDLFLAAKRSLGRKYDTEEAALQLLLNFTRQHDIKSLYDLTPRFMEQFVASRPRSTPRSYNHLVGVVTNFFDWAVAYQHLDQSPVHLNRVRDSGPAVPFLFASTQVKQLLDAATALPDNSKAVNRAAIYHAIFALCYGLGLRSGEACRLTVGDIDLDRQLVVIRGTKFGKTRLVPYGPRIGALLQDQLRRCATTQVSAPVFSFNGVDSLHRDSASRTFTQLVTQLNFPIPPQVRPPCLHSLRHSFAVNCLLQWYHQGQDPGHMLFRLSTFMGHVDPASTAVYLTITPGLLEQANQRFEAFAHQIWEEETS